MQVGKVIIKQLVSTTLTIELNADCSKQSKGTSTNPYHSESSQNAALVAFTRAVV